MRLHYLAIVLGLSTLGACAKKPAVQQPVPAATTPSDPQPEAAGAAAPAAAPAASEAPAPGSRGPVKKGGDPQDGGE
jgi:hypothetical protein